MNFFEYIGVTKERFIEDYLHTGLVTEAIHKEFPLNIFTYGRKAVHENVWDGVTSKCRGIIIHRETEEIIARPFEKFHNYGREAEDTSPVVTGEPTIVEKMDGFMCTMYFWAGKHYIASKGSFHSVHAKWATAELNRRLTEVQWSGGQLFPGHTAVFEGICRDLRIVVDYGAREHLVLLAIINNETGEEIPPDTLGGFGNLAGWSAHAFRTPKIYRDIDMSAAVRQTMATGYENAEGFVLTWYRTGMPPFRLKLKYVEYLRLHRMVTGVSPKRIWEVLSQAHRKADLDEYLKESTPWFSAFVSKWITTLRAEYDRLHVEATNRYFTAKEIVRKKYDRCELEFSEIRKAFALEFTKPENEEFSSIMFAMLDDKDVSKVIWKRVKAITTGANPMIDIHSL